MSFVCSWPGHILHTMKPIPPVSSRDSGRRWSMRPESPTRNLWNRGAENSFEIGHLIGQLLERRKEAAPRLVTRSIYWLLFILQDHNRWLYRLPVNYVRQARTHRVPINVADKRSTHSCYWIVRASVTVNCPYRPVDFTRAKVTKRRSRWELVNCLIVDE